MGFEKSRMIKIDLRAHGFALSEDGSAFPAVRFKPSVAPGSSRRAAPITRRH
jgi:hypothetical protein